MREQNFLSLHKVNLPGNVEIYSALFGYFYRFRFGKC